MDQANLVGDVVSITRQEFLRPQLEPTLIGRWQPGLFPHSQSQDESTTQRNEERKEEPKRHLCTASGRTSRGLLAFCENTENRRTRIHPEWCTRPPRSWL